MLTLQEFIVYQAPFLKGLDSLVHLTGLSLSLKTAGLQMSETWIGFGIVTSILRLELLVVIAYQISMVTRANTRMSSNSMLFQPLDVGCFGPLKVGKSRICYGLIFSTLPRTVYFLLSTLPSRKL
jgi:hypothetical protein